MTLVSAQSGRTKFGYLGNLDEEIDNAYVVEVLDNITSIGLRIIPPTGGEIVFEGSYGMDVWETIELRNVSLDVIENSATADAHYIGSVLGLRWLRFRTLVAGSESGSVIGRLLEGASILESIFGYPPHLIGEILIHKNTSFTTIQTNQPIWTPETDKKFVLTDLIIVAQGNTDAVITIFDKDNEEGHIVFKGKIDVSMNRQYSFNHAFRVPFESDAKDNSLRLTTSAAINIDVVCHGYEIDG